MAERHPGMPASNKQAYNPPGCRDEGSSSQLTEPTKKRRERVDSCLSRPPRPRPLPSPSPCAAAAQSPQQRADHV